MELSIIVINWNSRDYVAACLRSVFEHAPAIPFEVIVLDSGSFDGCGEMIARDFPQARFIQSTENLGFARANNLAVTQAKGSTFLFLNPDTEVKAGAITALYEIARNVSDAGAIGARLLNTDGTLQTSCVQAFPTILNQVFICDLLIRLFPDLSLWGKSSLFREGSEPREVEAVSGAAMMMRREVFQLIDGFCEDYFMYSEDIDLCFQARAVGRRNLYVAQAHITHHGGGSSTQQPSRFSCTTKALAVQHYFKRNRSLSYAVLYRFGVGISAVARLVLLSVAEAIEKGSRRTNSRAGSIAKWWFILCWTIGIEATPSRTRTRSSQHV